MRTQNSTNLAQPSVPLHGKTPGGIRGHWFWGVINRIQQDPLALYWEAWHKYGDVARLHLIPGLHFYLVTHPDDVEHVLVKQFKNYPKPASFNKPVAKLVGLGILTNEGDSWLRQRRLCQPAFQRHNLDQLGSQMVAAADACREKWTRMETGTTFDMQDDMLRLSLRVASTTLFSTDISHDTDLIRPAFRRAFAYISHAMNSAPLIPSWVPTRANRQFAEDKRLLDRVILDIIAERRRNPNLPHDLLSLLLAAQDEETGTGMTDRQLKDEALTLLTAGHDTVSAALSWTWYLLGQHPEIQEQMHDEIHGVLQGRNPTAEDLPKLSLTRAIFDESLRLYPPAWGMPRQSLVEDELNGYLIPKGSLIALGTCVTHRHPDFWSTPNEFRPERFLDHSGAFRHKYAYYPFGGGPRICLGRTFALLEGPLVLATLAQQFRIQLAPNQTVIPDTTFTLRPRNGVQVNVHRRL